MKLLAGWAGAFGGLILAEVLGQKGIPEFCICVVGFVAGWWLGGSLKNTIECTLTAFVGSGIFVNGVQMYAGGFGATSWSLWAYIGGGIALGLGGAIFQRYMFRDDDKRAFEDEDGDGVDDKDVMRDDEETRICGCF